MKKQFIIISIIVALLFATCACEKKENTGAPTENTTAKEDSQNASVGSVVSGPDTIDLTLPAIIFGMATGEELSQGSDLKDYAKRNNFINARWESDLALTVKMTKDRYEEYKADMAIPVEENLEGILTYPCVEGIEKEEDYKAVTIIVDNAALEEHGIASAEDLTSYYHIPMLGSYINVYRMLVGLDNAFSIFINDSTTGIELGRIDYPLSFSVG